MTAPDDPTQSHRPRMRSVEALPVPSDGPRLFALRDANVPEIAPLVVTEAGLLICQLLDGSRTAQDVVAAVEQYTGQSVPIESIATFIASLDESLLLHGPRYEAHTRRIREAFLGAPARPAAHAGGAYPAEPTELRAFLDEQYGVPDGPGGPPGHPQQRSIAAMIAPHVDLHRGGPTYAWAYRALAEAPPAETYLLLGTSHHSMRNAFGALRKPYATPLGDASLDRELLDAVASRLGPSLFDDELVHRGEHALEFQALYLRYLAHVGPGTGGRIVPILCNALQAYVPPGTSPRQTDAGHAFIEALQDAVAETGRRVCIIAGADLAHVGPQFGDATPLTPADLERVGQGDAEMLDLVCRGDADGFYAQVMADGDARRICGLAPIYYTLALNPSGPGQLLRYTQWSDPTGHAAVTFASVVFRE